MRFLFFLLLLFVHIVQLLWGVSLCFCSGGMPSIGVFTPEYTNVIINCISADGLWSTPAVLYSYDPVFDLAIVDKAQAGPVKGKELRVKKAKAQLALLTAALAKYSIADDRIVYIESEKSKYCAESADIYKHFLKKYKSRLNHKDTVMIRDAGKSFTPGGVSVLETITPLLGHEVVLPPILHHYHSICDNRHHGVAKAKWRTLESHADDLESSLFLLDQLDQVSGDHIKKWFARNFCFETFDKSEAILTKALEALYFGKQAQLHEYHDDCLEAYYVQYPEEKLEAEAVAVKKATAGYMTHAKDRQ